MKIHQFSLILLISMLIFVLDLNAQDPGRFNTEIENIVRKEHFLEPGRKLLLFTGSSSVRMWTDIQNYFPGFNVINNGFGGSHFSDLIHFYNKLIPVYQPDILFIYEGDNDIASGKKPKIILKEAKFLLAKIRRDLPETQIVLISPKPSIARWEMRKDYKKLNKKLNRLARKTTKVEYADVWKPMLDEKGNVLQDVFLEDKLHMNKKGYDIWAKVLSGFVQQ